MKKYKVGLIIGRFQPLHRGHRYLIQEGLKMSDQIIIGVGSANVSDFENPYTAEQRIEVLKKTYKKELEEGIIKKIIPLDDNPSDETWLQELLQKTGPIDVVIGNNERVKGIMEKAGYKIEPVPFYKREIYEGKKLREKLRKKNLL